MRNNEERQAAKQKKTILQDGRAARNKLIKAKKKGLLPEGSFQLYRAMRKAGLDI